jgi:hypothetical protein
MSIRRAVACSGRGPVSTTNFSGTGKDSAVPLDALWIATQALRAWLLSACPSGTKGMGLSRASHPVSAYGRLALLGPRLLGPFLQEHNIKIIFALGKQVGTACLRIKASRLTSPSLTWGSKVGKASRLTRPKVILGQSKPGRLPTW